MLIESGRFIFALSMNVQSLRDGRLHRFPVAAIVDAFVSRVMVDWELSRTAKEDLLKDLSSWPLVLERVAGSQTRLSLQEKRGADGGCEVLVASFS